MPDSIQIELCESLSAFRRLASAFLAARPADHGLIDDVLAKSGALASGEERTFQLFVATRGLEVVGSVVFALPRTVFLPVMHWSAATALAADMAKRGLSVPSIIGPQPSVDSFASAWTAATGNAFSCRHKFTLYETRAIVNIRTMAGELRLAQMADLDRIVSWQEAFVRETNISDDIRPVRQRVYEQLTDGRLYVWDHDGPKSTIAHSSRRLGSARIYGVYTPPEVRSQGYATAMTAAMSRRLLETNHERCILFAAANNPTSNRMYQKIGYRDIGAWKELEHDDRTPDQQTN